MNKAYGVSSIIPTKAVTITDDISGYSVTQLMSLTSVNYNQSRVPIVVSNQANTTRIGIDIDNKDVNEQYDYYGIGVYFKQVNTGEEVLFSVIPLTGAATIIPNQSGVATSSISIDSYTSIVPGTKVDLSVSDSGSVTRSDVEQIVAANQSYSFPKKPAASGIDFYTLKSVGIYQIKDDKTVVNAPDGFSGNGYIIVIGDGTTANPITQDLFDTVTGNKYSNSYDSDGNKWTGWEKVASMSDVTTTLNNGLITKVNTTDMRKPASDVAGIEEVNAKQDKIGYTPADDSKVVHNSGNEEISGSKTFDTAPIDKTTGNPYITKDHTDKLLGSLTSFKPTGSNLIDKLNSEFNNRGVNVKWFGAKGDGVTDDSDAIQAAVVTGSSVFVPAGTYLITKTISLKLQNFIGAGANQTFFNVQNADLFELETGGRSIAEIANFSVESLGANANNNSVFKSKEDPKQRAETYHFHDIEINGGYFLYGFNLTDSFRVTINKIGMTNVFNPFLLRGQIVQTTINDVTCNIDTVELGALNNYNTGIEIVGDSHSGSYQRPESVRLSNVNFVGYDLGYNIKDVLYFVSDKFECDYCANGIRTFSTDGGVTFTNGWIAVQNRRDTPSVGIDVLPSIQNVLKPVAFDNINISGLAGLDASSVAVRVGYDESPTSWFRQGVTAQNLWISAANSAFKYAVQANRAKTLTLNGIKVTTDTAQMDFYLVDCESYSLKNLDGQTASIATIKADNSILENCNIPNLEIIGAYPQYYNNGGVLRTTNRSIDIVSTDDTTNNYTHNLSVNSGNLWVNKSNLMYKFGEPASNTDGSRVIRVADVTSLPNPDASIRGDIYTLKGTTDKVYMCVYQTNAFVWKQLI